MERLLRRYGRREADALPGGRAPSSATADAAGDGEHLDADELSAYTEGSLPAAARAHYVAHLADCDACRKIVAALAPLASAALKPGEAVADPPGKPARASWKDWLAALFSPPVLRYGVPALLLFAVIAVAFIATRGRRESSVALNQQAPADSAARSGNSAQSSTAMSTAANANTSAEEEAHTSSTVPDATRADEAPAIAPAGKPAAVNATPAPVSTPERGASRNEPMTAGNRPEQQARERAQETESNAAPPAAPVAASTSRPVEEARDTRVMQDKPSVRSAGSLSAKTGSDAQATADSSRNEASAGTAAGTTRPAPAARAKMSAGRGRSGAPRDDAGVAAESPAETRSIAGRQFRRQGSAWVDTAYNSSRRTTDVRRGSEHYRGLLADETGLRSITNQLGGEVIVVWKGTAYRFY